MAAVQLRDGDKYFSADKYFCLAGLFSLRLGGGQAEGEPGRAGERGGAAAVQVQPGEGGHERDPVLDPEQQGGQRQRRQPSAHLHLPTRVPR